MTLRKVKPVLTAKPVPTLPREHAALDRGAILAALSVARGYQPDAAEELGTTVRTLQRRLDALGLRPELAAKAAAEGWPDQAARARDARLFKHGHEPEDGGIDSDACSCGHLRAQHERGAGPCIERCACFRFRAAPARTNSGETVACDSRDDAR